jgi:hypothetical protein
MWVFDEGPDIWSAPMIDPLLLRIGAAEHVHGWNFSQ